jgi:hypothetical protein
MHNGICSRCATLTSFASHRRATTVIPVPGHSRTPRYAAAAGSGARIPPGSRLAPLSGCPQLSRAEVDITRTDRETAEESVLQGPAEFTFGILFIASGAKQSPDLEIASSLRFSQ